MENTEFQMVELNTIKTRIYDGFNRPETSKPTKSTKMSKFKKLKDMCKEPLRYRNQIIMIMRDESMFNIGTVKAIFNSGLLDNDAEFKKKVDFKNEVFTLLREKKVQDCFKNYRNMNSTKILLGNLIEIYGFEKLQSIGFVFKKKKDCVYTIGTKYFAKRKIPFTLRRSLSCPIGLGHRGNSTGNIR